MNWNIPNQLTVGRIGLSLVFFVLLAMYEPGAAGARWLLNGAFIIFVIAGITDFLDGYLARKWNQVSVFGRIADPFVDKLLIVGAFVMLAGSNFQLVGGEMDQKLPGWLVGDMASAVRSWMVVAVLAREFIVSAIRGYSESQGIQFSATYAGKIKMIVQLFALGTVLFQMANVPDAMWAIWLKVILVWLAVIVTVLSGFAYVNKARGLFTGEIA
jgi:CDP-diacylglycerol---glycerol-3-phosphate 3-phosphatidyltransferase